MKVPKAFTEEQIAYSTNGAGKNGKPHVNKIKLNLHKTQSGSKTQALEQRPCV